jgi:hypothetical protein
MDDAKMAKVMEKYSISEPILIKPNINIFSTQEYVVGRKRDLAFKEIFIISV